MPRTLFGRCDAVPDMVTRFTFGTHAELGSACVSVTRGSVLEVVAALGFD